MGEPEFFHGPGTKFYHDGRLNSLMNIHVNEILLSNKSSFRVKVWNSFLKSLVLEVSNSSPTSSYYLRLPYNSQYDVPSRNPGPNIVQK